MGRWELRNNFLIYDPHGYLENNVTIPVKVVNGKLEYFYGGDLPKLEDGIIGELVLPIFAINDKAFLKSISHEVTVDFLPKGTKLFASMYVDNFAAIDQKLRPFMEGLQYVPIVLNEDLQFKFRGTKKSELLQCKCQIEALGIEARSLNQAYSLISEKYEIQRMSHTGNVFTKISYKVNDHYVPISVIREEKAADYEKEYLLKDSTQ